jgi:Asp/Glu/hydantoin racemase
MKRSDNASNCTDHCCEGRDVTVGRCRGTSRIAGIQARGAWTATPRRASHALRAPNLEEPMRGPIVVINPNSTEAVTRAIDAALAPLRLSGGPEIECQTLAEGPPGIESQSDADAVIAPLCRSVAAQDNSAAAFVIACFSDPGLHSAREATAKPVLGIAECGILTALTLGQRFGVVSILAKSVPRHLRYYGAMGVGQRLAGDLPIGLGVTALADGRATLARMTETGAALRDRHGADVLVLGCAGMASYRAALEEALGLPVVDPTQAAVTMAIGRVCLGGSGTR